MIYSSVYFDETNQKLRWTTTAPENLKFKYEYIGKMTRVEFDLLVEVLFDIYQDQPIKLTEFANIFGDIRKFCDQIKKILDDDDDENYTYQHEFTRP